MTWIDVGMYLSFAAAVASILSMMMLQENHNYESYSGKRNSNGCTFKSNRVTVDDIVVEQIMEDDE